MEIVSYAAVIKASSPALWPCHERYADKLPRQLRHYILVLRGVQHYTRVVF